MKLALLLPLLTTAAQGASFYVNPTAGGGGNNGLSWASGWVAFDQINWSLVHGGDVVYLHGGLTGSTFTYAGDFTTPLNIPVNNVTVSVGQDAGHNGTAILSGQYVNTPGTSGVTLTGNVGGAPHLILSDFFDTVNRTFANKVLADGTSGFTMTFCVCSNVNQGVSLVGAQGFNIASNTIYARGDAAVRAVNSPDNGWDSHTVARNLIFCDYDTAGGGTYLGPDGVQASHGITVVSNIFTIRPVTYQTSTQHPDFTQIIGNHVKIIANEFINIGDSGNDFDWIFNPTPHDILIANNLYRITSAIDPFPEYIRWYVSGGHTITSLSNFQIVNNTFANNPSWPNIFGQWSGSTPTVSGCAIANNIFYNGAFNVANASSLSAASIVLSNNVYSPTFTNTWRGTNYSGPQMVASGSGPDQAGLSGVPTFVSGSDFHLASTNSVGWAHALNYNSVFATDKDGVVRGATWDDGAYQYVNSGDTSVPATPSNVSPANLATSVALQPTLTGSAYSATGGNTQTAAQFQVFASDGVTLVQDSGSIAAAISWPLPVPLNNATTYKWKCRYANVNGFSPFSSLTAFTTGAAATQYLTIKVQVLKTGQIVVVP